MSIAFKRCKVIKSYFNPVKIPKKNYCIYIHDSITLHFTCNFLYLYFCISVLPSDNLQELNAVNCKIATSYQQKAKHANQLTITITS